jgi:hypothetical protein
MVDCWLGQDTVAHNFSLERCAVSRIRRDGPQVCSYACCKRECEPGGILVQP